MMHHSRRTVVLLALLSALFALGAVADTKPPEKPADVRVDVRPAPAAAGSTVEVEVRLEPISGIKINRYPRISVMVPAVAGVVAESSASVGNERPPSPEDMEAGKNYFKTVDPVRLSLALDPAIPPGEHVIPANLKYFYCVSESGFCAPKKTSVDIPVTVR
jgi:hypothetical protein